MPDGLSSEASQPAQPMPPPAGPHWLELSGLAVVIAVAASAAWTVWRGRALRAWRAFAAENSASLRTAGKLSPSAVAGTLAGRDFLLETSLGHEDDAPYYHTRFRVPVRNRSGFVAGVRRKSILEEAQTRRDRTAPLLDDPEFERQFFVVTNSAEDLAEVLLPEVRSELRHYPDIEIYARLDELEWRRAGECADLPAMRRLNALLLKMADRIEALRSRERTLTERLADEELIAKGI